ncbi:MAG: hypothetical protein IPK32_13965 [Verrucomicrobiaceae bacterium]|nr:hypothetical protein [Verrucomicrobiaceae bacterium]
MPLAKDYDLTPAFENFDGWVSTLDDRQKEAINQRFQFVAPEDMESERKRFLSTALISQETGHSADEITRSLDAYYIPAFSQQRLGLPVMPKDADEFYDHAKKKLLDVKDEKAVFGEGYNAAFQGDDVIKSLQAWQQKNGIDRLPKSSAFTKGFLQARGLLGNMPISEAVDAYQRSMTGASQEGDDGLLADFEERLLTAPDDQRKLALHSAAMIAKARSSRAVKGLGDSVTGFTQEVGESFGRFINKMGGIAKDEELEILSKNFTLPALTDAAKSRAPLATGIAYTSIENIDSPEKASQFLKEWKVAQFGTASTSVTRGDVDAQTQVEKQYRPLTDDEKTLIEAARKKEFKKNQIARELRSIAESTDPVGAVSGGIGSSVAMMAIGYATRGKTLPISWQLYSEANYDALKLKNPEMSTGIARAVTRTAASGEAALDLIGIKALSKLPSVLNVLKHGTKAAVAEAGLKGLGTLAFENFQEGVQDFTMPVTQQLFHALGADVPGVDWAEEWKNWKDSRADVFLATLPTMLLGLGAVSYRDVQSAKGILAGNEQLARAGVVESDRLGVLQKAQAGDLAGAQALLREAWGRRDSAVAAEFQAQAEVQSEERRMAVSELERIGETPTIRKDGDGYTVSIGETSTRFKSWEDARDVAQAGMNDMERAQTELVVSIADSFMGGTPSFLKGESVEFSPDSETMGAKIARGDISFESAFEAAIAGGVVKGVSLAESRAISAEVFGPNPSERAMRFRADVEKIAVLGSNKVDGGESKSRVFGKGNERAFLTAVEEITEGRWKAGLERRAFTREQGIRWVQLAEAATGETFLEGSTWGEISSSTEIAPRALTEAISRIVTADVLGRMKDGKRVGAGAISRGLDLSDREQSALAAILGAFRKLFRSILETASKLSKARKEGKLGAEYDTLFDALTGGTSQLEHDAAAANEADAIANEAVDTSGYSEETPGPNGETFSLSARNELENQTAMPLDERFSGLSVGELREAAQGYFKSNLAPLTELPITRDGRAVKFTMRGFREMRHHSADSRVLQMIPSLPEMLRKAVPIFSEENTEKTKPNILAFHHYAIKASLGGTEFYARIVVREDNNGNVQYDLDATDTILLQENGERSSGQPDRKPSAGEGQRTLAKNRLYQWWHEVNTAKGETFSLRPGDFAARMEAKFALFSAKPELRMAVAQVAKGRAMRLGAKLIEKGAVIRSAKDIDKEQAFREASGYDERIQAYLDSLAPNARQTLEFEPDKLKAIRSSRLCWTSEGSCLFRRPRKTVKLKP